MNKENKELKNWDKATDELAKVFIEKYFGKNYIYDDDYYWIGSQDKDREVLAVNDYFFNLDRIVNAIRYNATEKQLFDYYDKEVEFALKNKEMKINFRNYIKNNKLIKEL